MTNNKDILQILLLSATISNKRKKGKRKALTGIFWEVVFKMKAPEKR